MKPIKLKNRYVLAISGGVDSIVLLDLILKGTINKSFIVVAHIDHGIRNDSKEDLLLVKSIALKNNLQFFSSSLKLGPNTSEAEARIKRYQFLNEVVNQTSSLGIITAHHQDDLIETISINLIRGTNRKGLTSLDSSDIIYRPLLKYPKQKILEYAHQNNLIWREDSTNQETNYLRNHLRLKVLTKITPLNRQKLISINKKQKNINLQIDSILENLYDLKIKNNKIDRLWFIQLDFKTQKEIIAHWLRKNELYEFNSKQIERIVNSLKVASPGAIIEISKGYNFDIKKNLLALRVLER